MYISLASTMNLKNQRPAVHARSERSCLIIQLQLVGQLCGDLHEVNERNGVSWSTRRCSCLLGNFYYSRLNILLLNQLIEDQSVFSLQCKYL